MNLNLSVRVHACAFFLFWVASCDTSEATKECLDTVVSDVYSVRIAAAHDSRPEYFDIQLAELRETLENCDIPSEGVPTPFGESMSAAEIFLVAHLDDEMIEAAGELMIESEQVPALDRQLTALIFAAFDIRELQIATRLVEMGIEANRLDEVGNNLFAAAVGSRIEPVEKICYLFNQQIDPFHESDYGISSIDGAIDEGDVESLRALLALLSEEDPRSLQLIDSAKRLAATASVDLQAVIEAWPYASDVDSCRLVKK